MEQKLKAKTAIFLLLLTALTIIIFPIIGINPLSEFELSLLEYSKSFISNEQIFTSMTEDINMLSYNIYAYIVHILYEYIGIEAALALRIPSALLIIAITSTLYLFNAIYESLNHSFLSAALFICCGAIMLLTFTASPVLIPAYLLILALITLYNQIKRRSITHLILLTATITLVTLTIGYNAVVIIAIIAYIYLISTGEKSPKSYLHITAAIVIATIIAFTTVILINRDPFIIREILTLNNYSQYSNLYNFLIVILFATFPWSLPLIISLFWVIRKPKWVVMEFTSLKPLQQYGITILIATLPTLAYLNGLSIILIIATIFFNMIIMGNLFMVQLKDYALAFRLTGIVTAIIAASTALTYTILKTIPITILGYSLDLSNKGNNIWGFLIVALIALFIYTLTRNNRSIHQNNRYMYNIIILYLLAATLFIGYILPYGELQI